MLNMETNLGDTDSAYWQNLTEDDIETLNVKFIELYDGLLPKFNIDTESEIVFEYEKKFEKCIVTAKKRYYYKMKKGDEYVYNTAGGAYARSSCHKLASIEQFDLCKDILTKIYDMKLEEEHVKQVTKISKELSDYGQPVIDGKTGKQKRRKSDGALMFAPVPAQIRLAKELVARGESFQQGDMIEYVIIERSPNVALWIEDFRKEPRYDADYMWDRIEKPIIEILNVKCPELLYTYFRELWHYTEKQIKTLIEKLEVE